MKGVGKGERISQLVGLTSKMYSLVIVNDNEVEKAKGVNKNIA